VDSFVGLHAASLVTSKLQAGCVHPYLRGQRQKSYGIFVFMKAFTAKGRVACLAGSA